MIYAVVDTNVIVSAFLSRISDVATVKVFEAMTDGRICPLFNSEIIEEYREVLSRPKFHIPIQEIEEVIIKIQELGLASGRVHSLEDFPDMDDIVFYEVAMSKEDAYLVTGNTKHFPKSPIVVTPAEMVQIIMDQNK